MKSGEKLNILLFMDDLKNFAKRECEVNGLASTVQILSNELGWNLEYKSVVYLHRKEGK